MFSFYLVNDAMSRESIYIYNVALKQKENSEARGPTLE